MAVFSLELGANFGHGGGAVDQFTALGGFPAGQGIALQVLESALVDGALLLDEGLPSTDGSVLA
jgi:hypothetical protein